LEYRTKVGRGRQYKRSCNVTGRALSTYNKALYFLRESIVFNGPRAHTDIEIQTEDSAGIEEEQFMNIVYGKGKWHTGAV
jgi:hypothetical protein